MCFLPDRTEWASGWTSMKVHGKSNEESDCGPAHFEILRHPFAYVAWILARMRFMARACASVGSSVSEHPITTSISASDRSRAQLLAATLARSACRCRSAGNRSRSVGRIAAGPAVGKSDPNPVPRPGRFGKPGGERLPVPEMIGYPILRRRTSRSRVGGSSMGGPLEPMPLPRRRGQFPVRSIDRQGRLVRVVFQINK